MTSPFGYNYFRDYEPRVGRYLESDPLGIAAGINTFAYVGSSPLGNLDPFGLQHIRYHDVGLIINHLCWVAEMQGDNFWKSDDFAPERRMLERIRAGNGTAYDTAWYWHEIREAQRMLPYRSLPNDQAQQKQREIHNEIETRDNNTKYDRYHPDTYRNMRKRF